MYTQHGLYFEHVMTEGEPKGNTIAFKLPRDFIEFAGKHKSIELRRILIEYPDYFLRLPSLTYTSQNFWQDTYDISKDYTKKPKAMVLKEKLADKTTGFAYDYDTGSDNYSFLINSLNKQINSDELVLRYIKNKNEIILEMYRLSITDLRQESSYDYGIRHTIIFPTINENNDYLYKPIYGDNVKQLWIDINDTQTNVVEDEES